MNLQYRNIQDTTNAGLGESTAYDSVWTTGNPASAPVSALDRSMLAEDKLFVVLAVVLVIWFGIVAFILRTDRRIKALERTIQENTAAEIEH